MHIKTYLNQLNSQQKQKLKNIFINTAQKKYHKNNTHTIQLQTQNQTIPIKSSTKKHSDSAFDDEIFTALYKINRKLSYERYNTLSDKTQTPKLTFKLNYVENHRPILKQKYTNKLINNNQNNLSNNQFKQQNNKFLPQSKQSKIEKYIIKNNDTAIIKFNNSTKNKNLSIKEKLFKNSQKNHSKMSFEIDRYRTLSSRQVQSSLGNYQRKKLSTGKSSFFHLSPQKSNQRLSPKIQLPQYAQNILKPCKIQGIELIDRPLTTLGRRKSEKIGKNVQQITDKKMSLMGVKGQDEWNIRIIKTARQGNRKATKMNESRFRNPQKQRAKIKAQLQPWGQQQQDLQQDHEILFSIQ